MAIGRMGQTEQVSFQAQQMVHGSRVVPFDRLVRPEWGRLRSPIVAVLLDVAVGGEGVAHHAAVSILNSGNVMVGLVGRHVRVVVHLVRWVVCKDGYGEMCCDCFLGGRYGAVVV